MAFAGYLLKIDGVIFPNKFIAMETYQITPNQKIDDETYTDGDGVLHRSVLPHDRTKAEFNTTYIKEADSAELQSYFPDTLSASVQYWNPKKSTYETGTFYVPDITFEIYSITATSVLYKPIRIAFIEY